MNQIRIIRQEEIDDALHELFSGKKKGAQTKTESVRQNYQPEPVTMRYTVSHSNTNQVQAKLEFSFIRAGLVLMIGAVSVGWAYLNSPLLREQIEHIYIEMIFSLKELVHVEPFVVFVGLSIILLVIGFVTKK